MRHGAGAWDGEIGPAFRGRMAVRGGGLYSGRTLATRASSVATAAASRSPGAMA